MAMAEQKNRPGPDVLSSSNEEEESSQKSRQPVNNNKLPLPPPLSRGMSQKKAPRRPSAEEMIEYYVKKGLDKQAATEKVIDDLQKALTIAVNRYPSRKAQEAEKTERSVSGTLETLSNRLSAVEAKVDEKPNSGGVFMAGVAAGGFLQAVPHVFRAMSQVGRSVTDAISSSRV